MNAPLALASLTFAACSVLACHHTSEQPDAADAAADANADGDAGADAAADASSTADAAATDADGSSTADANPDANPDAPITLLRSAGVRAHRLIGAALGAAHLTEADFAATAAAEFDYATPENEMKWDATEPTRNTFTFAAADSVVAFAAAHGIVVKGHTLVWYSQLPSWVPAITDPIDLHNAMINHITNVVSHFRGQVIAWDVVNEAMNDNGQTLRSTPFYNLLGSGYIDDAFNAAHAADPNARLYYNDYGAEGAGAKSDAVYNMVQGMLARNVPINGVGLQMHTGPADASPSAAQVATNMQRLAALGLDVVISEMDVQICTSDLVTQEARFHDIAAVCVAQPGCKAITVWGVPDKYSWRNGQTCATPRPLLFDDNYIAKPAHDGVLNAFLGL